MYSSRASRVMFHSLEPNVLLTYPELPLSGAIHVQTHCLFDRACRSCVRACGTAALRDRAVESQSSGGSARAGGVGEKPSGSSGPVLRVGRTPSGAVERVRHLDDSTSR